MEDIKKEGRLTIRLSIQPLIRILPGLFFLANLFRMLMFSSRPYIVSLYIVGPIGLLAAVFNRKYRLDRITVFFLIYVLTLILNWLTVKNVSFSSIAVNILLIGITYIMLIKRWSYKEGIVFFYTSTLMMVYGINASTVRRILVSSTNYVSVLMLLAVSFYYITIDIENKKLRILDMLPALICFWISIWARGRGGILSSAVLLCLILYNYMRTLADKRVIRSVVIVITIMLICTVFIIRKINLLDVFMSLGKWETRGVDNSARLYIWSSYLSKVRENFVYFLLGPPLNDIPIVYYFDGNTHNSFLQLHAYNGIIMFIIYISMLIRSFSFYLKSQQYVIASMSAALVIRGMSDKFVFGQYGMPIMLFLVLYPYIARQEYCPNKAIYDEETTAC